MKRVLTGVLILVMVLTCTVMAFGDVSVKGPLTEPMTKGADWYHPNTGRYEYPIKPDTAQWKSFESHGEMLRALAIPEEVLKTISTADLADLALRYPLLGDFRAANTPEEGLKAVIHDFNGLQELLVRKDGMIALIEAYQEIPVEQDGAVPDELIGCPNGSFETALDQLKREQPQKYRRLCESIDNVNQLEFCELLFSVCKERLSPSETSRLKKYSEQKQQQKSRSSLYR